MKKDNESKVKAKRYDPIEFLNGDLKVVIDKEFGGNSNNFMKAFASSIGENSCKSK